MIINGIEEELKEEELQFYPEESLGVLELATNPIDRKFKQNSNYDFLAAFYNLLT